jgi:hypothetical protein
MSDIAGENPTQSRSMVAYVFVNTLKWALIAGIVLVFGKFQFRVNPVNRDLLGFAVFAVALSIVVGFVAALIQWHRIERQELVTANRKLAIGNRK